MAVHALESSSSATAIIKSLSNQWDNAVLTRFHQIAREKIQQQVAIGNNQFGVQVDGRAADYARINKARKVIRVQFAGQALKVALRIAREELVSSIKESTTTRTGKLSSDIVVFVGRQGKQYEVIDKLDEFRFSPGDIIAFAAMAPYSAVTNRNVTVANSKRRTAAHEARKRKVGPIQPAQTKRGQGFMAIAAKRINKTIGSQRGLGSISVTAGFSKALESQFGPDQYGKKQNNGIPAIFVTLRFLTRSRVIGF